MINSWRNYFSVDLFFLKCEQVNLLNILASMLSIKMFIRLFLIVQYIDTNINSFPVLLIFINSNHIKTAGFQHKITFCVKAHTFAHLISFNIYTLYIVGTIFDCKILRKTIQIKS
jgi:hypothetical protein